MLRPLSRRTLALTIAVTSAAVMAAPGVTASAAPAVSSGAAPIHRGTSERFVKLWVPEWMARRTTPYSTAELQAMAARFSVIAAMPNKFKSAASFMKSVNPDLRLVVYKNATFGGAGLPEDMFARNASGGKVAAREWPSTFVMKLDDPRWRAHVAEKCVLLARTSNYDGCFLDVLGSGPLSAPAYLLSKPVNADGSVWTPNQWIGMSTKIAGAVEAALPGTVMGNGLGYGARYFDPTQSSRPLVSTLDGAMAEVFVRGPQDSVTRFRSEAQWKAEIDMIRDVEAQGKAAMTVTKIWTPATPAQVNQWHRYTVATFLLGTNGRSMMCFLRDKSTTSTLMDHPYNRVDIGSATADYAKVGATYQRPYTNGLVIANPTSSPVTVPLTGSFTTMDGARVTGSIVIPAHDGQALVRA